MGSVSIVFGTLRSGSLLDTFFGNGFGIECKSIRRVRKFIIGTCVAILGIGLAHTAVCQDISTRSSSDLVSLVENYCHRYYGMEVELEIANGDALYQREKLIIERRGRSIVRHIKIIQKNQETGDKFTQERWGYRNSTFSVEVPMPNDGARVGAVAYLGPAWLNTSMHPLLGISQLDLASFSEIVCLPEAEVSVSREMFNQVSYDALTVNVPKRGCYRFLFTEGDKTKLEYIIVKKALGEIVIMPERDVVIGDPDFQGTEKIVKGPYATVKSMEFIIGPIGYDAQGFQSSYRFKSRVEFKDEFNRQPQTIESEPIFVKDYKKSTFSPAPSKVLFPDVALPEFLELTVFRGGGVKYGLKNGALVRVADSDAEQQLNGLSFRKYFPGKLWYYLGFGIALVGSVILLRYFRKTD